MKFEIVEFGKAMAILPECQANELKKIIEERRNETSKMSNLQQENTRHKTGLKN
ncbi:MAG: hypothetical protein IKP66_06610 [Lachnospiraceae bacterium]|nr:hypothetical protein [Lachnospiraceae bacterium]